MVVMLRFNAFERKGGAEGLELNAQSSVERASPETSYDVVRTVPNKNKKTVPPLIFLEGPTRLRSQPSLKQETFCNDFGDPRFLRHGLSTKNRKLVPS